MSPCQAALEQLYALADARRLRLSPRCDCGTPEAAAALKAVPVRALSWRELEPVLSS
ncbi:MAG: hypothetical protein ACOZQL_04500 [Myxococcota bacterium]